MKRKEKQRQTKKAEGLGPSEVARRPPHLTLKPSPKQEQKREKKELFSYQSTFSVS